MTALHARSRGGIIGDATQPSSEVHTFGHSARYDGEKSSAGCVAQTAFVVSGFMRSTGGFDG